MDEVPDSLSVILSMDNKDQILGSDLARLKIAAQLVRTILVLEPEEHLTITGILWRWVERLQNELGERDHRWLCSQCGGSLPPEQPEGRS